jgi:hypothetical protein
MSQQIETRPLSAFPPWLWFWLILYLIELPNTITYLKDVYIKDFFTLLSSETKVSLYSVLVRSPGILEFIPKVAVMLGVITIFIPWFRKKIVERTNKFTHAELKGAIAEMYDFIAQYIPVKYLYVKTNLLRPGRGNPALSYPLGFRKFAIGLLRDMIILWRGDKSSAQVILQHEIAHCRQGDVFFVGSGSFFEIIIRKWVYLYLALVLIPGVIGFSEYILSGRHGGLTVEFFLPSLLSFSLGLILWTLATFIIPLAGIWCTELYADRFVTEVSNSNESILKILDQKPRFSLLKIIFSLFSHPPIKFRRWMALNYNTKTSDVILLCMFPFAFIIKLALLSGWVITIQLPLIFGSKYSQLYSRKEEIQSLIELLQTNIKSYVYGTSSLLLIMAVIVLLWPLIAPYWEWIFTRKKTGINWAGYWKYVISAMLIGLLSLSGYLIGKDQTKVEIPTVTQSENQHVNIGEIFTVDKLKIVVLGWERKEVTGFMAPKINLDDLSPKSMEEITKEMEKMEEVQKTLVMVELIIFNTDKETRLLSTLNEMTLLDNTGKEYQVDYSASIDLRSNNIPGNVAPGEKVRGVVGFHIDKTATSFTFIYKPYSIFKNESSKVFIDLGNKPMKVEIPNNFPKETVQPIYKLHDRVYIQEWDLILTVNEIITIEGTKGFPQPEDGYKFVAIDVTFKNQGTQEITLNSKQQMKLKDALGQTYDDDIKAYIAAQSNLPDGKLFPEQRLNTKLGYQIPNDVKELNFVFTLGKHKGFVKLPTLNGE